MHIRELGHLVLSVRDLEASSHFYGDLLGMRQIATMGGRSVFYVGEGGRTHHELLISQNDDPNAQRGKIGLSHFALKVGTTDDELKEALAELAGKGVEPERIVDHGGVTHSAYMKDPDGNTVEIYIDVQPEAWRHDPESGPGKGARPLVLA